jgi:hypothetical protein
MASVKTCEETRDRPDIVRRVNKNKGFPHRQAGAEETDHIRQLAIRDLTSTVLGQSYGIRPVVRQKRDFGQPGQISIPPSTPNT